MDAPALVPERIEDWLRELGLEPLARADRDDVSAWDIVLDGRRRLDLRTTIICDPGLGLICWAQLAPPIGDAMRRTYRTLLRWNDEFPFVKFSVSEDGRPMLSAELPARSVSVDELGLALVRLTAVADRLLDETAGWLWIGGRAPAGYADRERRNAGLLERFAGRLGELAGA